MMELFLFAAIVLLALVWTLAPLFDRPRPPAVPADPSAARVCPRCGTGGALPARFCTVCGQPLDAGPPAAR